MSFLTDFLIILKPILILSGTLISMGGVIKILIASYDDYNEPSAERLASFIRIILGMSIISIGLILTKQRIEVLLPFISKIGIAILAILILIIVLFLLLIKHIVNKKKEKILQIETNETIKEKLISLDNFGIKNNEIKIIVKNLVSIIYDIRKILGYKTITDANKTKAGRETELIANELSESLLLYSKIEKYAQDDFFDEELFIKNLNYFLTPLKELKDNILETDKFDLDIKIDVLKSLFPEKLEIKHGKNDSDINNQN